MNFDGAVLNAIGDPLRIQKLSLGNLAAGDVVVKIKATSLCHTDLEAVEGSTGTPTPFIPGHEAAGIVDWIGKDVSTLKIGDHVVVSWNPFCGKCYFCQKKQPIICSQYRSNAGQSFHFDGKPRIFLKETPIHQLMYSGSFAEYAVVTEDCAVRISSEIPFEVACLIGCGVMTGVGAAINIAQVSKGSSFAVIGCGAVGVSAIQGAKIAGAERIFAIDQDAKRLDFAKQFGATDLILATDDIIERIMQLTEGIGLDYVIESAGNELAFRLSVEIVRPGGQVVWLGKVSKEKMVEFRWGSIMGEKKIHRSSYGGANPLVDFPFLAQSYLDGNLKLDEYITNRIQLSDVNEGLDRLKAGKEVRSVIEFS
jgi:S-(hydroxymethyl)glutathione dehydrogenase/alcohol dehydrogenase